MDRLTIEDFAYTQVSSWILHLILLPSSNDLVQKHHRNLKVWFLGNTPNLFLPDNFHSQYQTSESPEEKASQIQAI